MVPGRALVQSPGVVSLGPLGDSEQGLSCSQRATEAGLQGDLGILELAGAGSRWNPTLNGSQIEPLHLPCLRLHPPVIPLIAWGSGRGGGAIQDSIVLKNKKRKFLLWVDYGAYTIQCRQGCGDRQGRDNSVQTRCHKSSTATSQNLGMTGFAHTFRTRLLSLAAVGTVSGCCWLYGTLS